MIATASAARGIWVQSLGRFGVVASGSELGDLRRQPVRAALLLFLALEREVTRGRILGVFWPDRTEAQGRHALSQALHKLRRGLDRKWVEAEGEALVATDELEIDARVFEQAVERGEHGAALALYGGLFLEGWRLHETSEYELWVEQRRARLERLFAVASRARIRQLEDAGDPESATAIARRWAALAPRDDMAHIALIELLAGHGLESEALRQHEDLRRMRADEGLELGPAVLARIERTLAPKPVRSLPAPPLSEDCVLVLPFDNLTGREELDPLGRMAADWITEGLDRVGVARIIPALDALEASRSATQAGGAAETGGRRLRLARESGAGILACGAYYAIGDALELQAQVLDAATGELRGTVEPVRVALNHETQGIALLRERVLGLLAAALEKDWAGLPTPPELGVRPPTYEAYRAYERGVEHFLKEEYTLAIPHLEQAIAHDPGFTRAILMAAATHGNLGQWERAALLVEDLEAVADRLSPYERAALRWHRARLAGDREAAYAIHAVACRRYPGTIAHFVAGLSALEVNRPGVTIAVYGGLDPERGWMRQFPKYWEVLTAAHHIAGDHDRELEVARRGRSQFPSLLSTLACEARALAALGELSVLDETLADSRGLPPQHGWSHGKVWLIAAEELRTHGRPEPACLWVGRAVDWFRSHAASGPLGATSRSDLGLSLYLARRAPEAEALFRRLALEFPRNLDYQGRLGTLAAARGDVNEALRAERALEAPPQAYLFGRNTLWRARIAARLGECGTGVELLRRAFAEGLPFGVDLHTDADLEPLQGLPSYRELVQPKG